MVRLLLLSSEREVSTGAILDGDDLLARWVREAHPSGRMGRRSADVVGSLRFAFYGRVSTADFQERASSRRWQRDAAEELIAGHGRIVAEYFDTSRSRRLSWSDRPQAAALLERVADPDRGFDAVVVGEYERAFCGAQLLSLLPQFEAHGVQLWLPEAHGPLLLDDASHRALVMLLGAQSKREVMRARWRALQAMRGQARDEGRFLGGRPLFGYRLVDAGPHPNPMHAQWGRRLQRYDPDPVTAPTVRWIFAQRLRGRSVSSIAAELNRKGVPCPSRADPVRNPHRPGASWGLTTVRAILMNAKYTGRQVWNRQPAHYTPPHLPGPFKTQRWAGTEEWVMSRRVVHPPLVSEQDFVAVQAVRALPAAGAGREYAFVGLLRCRWCRRLLESCWSHGRAAYRCQHGHTSVKPGPGGRRRRNLYVREDRLVEVLRALVGDDGSGVGAVWRPHELAGHLRRQRLVVICSEAECALAPTTAV